MKQAKNLLKIPKPKLSQKFYNYHYQNYKSNLQNFLKIYLQKFFNHNIKLNNKFLKNLLNIFVNNTQGFSINTGKCLRPYFSYITLYQIIKNLKQTLTNTPNIPAEKLYETKLALLIGAYLELIHNHLLIHDDIMDKSIKRRNMLTTWFFLYKKLKNKHIANSIAILSGNITLITALDLLTEIKSINQNGITKALKVTTNILKKVNYGQILDIGIEKVEIQDIDLGDILAIYKNKTAIYTNVFPILFVSKMFNANNIFINTKNFYTSLLNLGIIFQIIDDLKDLATNQKTKYLDIIDKKRTILVYFTLKNATPTVKKQLINYYNKNNSQLLPKRIANFIKTYGMSDTQKYILQLWHNTLKLYEHLNEQEKFILRNQMYILKSYYDKIIDKI